MTDEEREEDLREWARRLFLGEAAVIVKPGETLVIRTTDLNPMQIEDYQEYADRYTASLETPFQVLIVHGDDFGVVTAASDLTAFLKDVRVDQDRAAIGGALLSTHLTHIPSGIEATGRTMDEAIALLASKIHRAHVAIRQPT